MAKGAAMLAPNMATMLAVLTTDAACDPVTLAVALLGGGRDQLQPDERGRLHLDQRHRAGAGQRGQRDASRRSTPSPTHWDEACGELAGMMAADAEGATKVAHVVVTGAPSDDEAHRAARKVAESALVKCSLNGEDPYWGRVVSELGSAGVAFDMDRVESPTAGWRCAEGAWRSTHDEKAVRGPHAGRSIEMRCDLGLGGGRGAMLSTDLGHGYIDENRTTS